MSEEVKVKSKTEEFKSELQAKVSEILGTKVSKQVAWNLFKELSRAPYSFILKNYDKAGKPAIAYGEKHKELELPLSGVGTYKVITTGKADNFTVKGRYYLSSALDNAIKEKLGFAADVETGELTEEVSETPGAPAGEFDDLDI